MCSPFPFMYSTRFLLSIVVEPYSYKRVLAADCLNEISQQLKEFIPGTYNFI